MQSCGGMYRARYKAVAAVLESFWRGACVVSPAPLPPVPSCASQYRYPLRCVCVVRCRMGSGAAARWVESFFLAALPPPHTATCTTCGNTRRHSLAERNDPSPTPLAPRGAAARAEGAARAGAATGRVRGLYTRAHGAIGRAASGGRATLGEEQPPASQSRADSMGRRASVGGHDLALSPCCAPKTNRAGGGHARGTHAA
jgi:hypothetical protein